ncbi:MAG: DUF2726 domain-containing protein [Nitrospiraceae bacterium]
MEGLLIGIGLAVVGFVFWQKLAPRGAKQSKGQAPVIPVGVLLVPQPVLTETEAFVYNLMRLAVQDQFLVLAQVPLWCVVRIEGEDGKARSQMLSRIALKRIDFVLVHPGTRVVEKAIELEAPSPASRQRQERDRLIESVLQAAGVELVRLNAQQSSTIPALAALLGVEAVE